jgi:hypothetical protein
MNAQPNTEKDSIILQSNTLVDLSVTDEQAQQAKGGADSTVVTQTGWFRYSTTNP